MKDYLAIVVTDTTKDGEMLFWSNVHGWTDNVEDATTYVSMNYNLPIGDNPQWFIVYTWNGKLYHKQHEYLAAGGQL